MPKSHALRSVRVSHKVESTVAMQRSDKPVHILESLRFSKSELALKSPQLCGESYVSRPKNLSLWKTGRTSARRRRGIVTQ
jgi:hypothetical protein